MWPQRQTGEAEAPPVCCFLFAVSCLRAGSAWPSPFSSCACWSFRRSCRKAAWDSSSGPQLWSELLAVLADRSCRSPGREPQQAFLQGAGLKHPSVQPSVFRYWDRERLLLPEDCSPARWLLPGSTLQPPVLFREVHWGRQVPLPSWLLRCRVIPHQLLEHRKA